MASEIQTLRCRGHSVRLWGCAATIATLILSHAAKADDTVATASANSRPPFIPYLIPIQTRGVERDAAGDAPEPALPSPVTSQATTPLPAAASLDLEKAKSATEAADRIARSWIESEAVFAEARPLVAAQADEPPEVTPPAVAFIDPPADDAPSPSAQDLAPTRTHTAEEPKAAPATTLEPVIVQERPIASPHDAEEPGIAPSDQPSIKTYSPAKPVQSDRPERVTQVDIPLLLDRLTLGDIPAYVSTNDELIAVDGAAFLKLIARHLLPEKTAALRQRIRSTGQLTIIDMRAEGLTPEYDVSRVELRLGIPLEMRTTQSLSLVQGYGAEPGELLGAADVSGYINFLSGKEFVSPSQGTRPPFVTDFDGAFSVRGYTLEGVATYRDNAASTWQRGNVRFLHDEPDTRTRYSMGDLTYNLDGFQSFQSSGGIAIARNFGLQPYRSSAPVGQSDLNLDRNARVDVLVNGQMVRTLNLTPGRYNVRDFPLVGGTNDVTLRVTDEVGRVNYIRFPFVFDATVLAAGEQDFSYIVGVPSTTTAHGPDYHDNDHVISAYHAYGLTDQLTIGANYQGSNSVNVVGAEGRLATMFGTFRADTAFSDASFEQSGSTPPSSARGTASRLQYRYAEPLGLDSANQNLAGTLSFHSPWFTSLGQTSVTNNQVSLDAGFVYGRRIVGDLNGSLGIDRQFGRSGQPDVTSIDTNFSYPISDEITSYLLLSTRQGGSTGTDNRIFFSISWFPRGTGHRVASSYDTDQRTSRLDYSYTPATRVDSVQGDLSVSRDKTNNNVQGQVGYTGYRFNTSVFRTMDNPRDGGGGTSSTTVNFGTALAFADGHYAVTRPITDSFALFAPHPSLSGQTIEINPIGDIPEAKTDLLGPAVMPELNSYYQRHITIDAPDLPLGYEIGRQVYDVQPPYRSGILIPMGTGATVLGDGVIVDAGDKALALEPGTIVSLDDPKRPPIEFFTNRSGRFRVEGLSPGQFRLTLSNDPEHAIEFTIPADSSGRIDLGRLTYAMQQ